MSEKVIKIDKTDLIGIYGTNNEKLDFIRSFFPEIKLISRGVSIKIIGSDSKINSFTKKFNIMINHYEKYNSLTKRQIERIISEKNYKLNEKDDVIFHSFNGKVIKARTFNQYKIVKEIINNDMLFLIGPAGTGKTYTAVALAVKALKLKQVKRIILTRPAIEAGENLGFLPGDLKEKLDPYMQPLYDALFDMLPVEKLNNYIEKRIIQIAPLAFMRGRTLDNAFVILDEAQNTTENQMKMFLTRMGNSAKFIITGDITQIDLPNKSKSGLILCEKKLKKINDISFIYLDEIDIIRHRIVKDIIKVYN